MTPSGQGGARARLRPELTAQHPSIPSGAWHTVLPCNLTALRPDAEPGLVWMEVEGRRRKLPAEYFEFRDIPGRGESHP
jgi:hypothetical protein